MEIIFRYFRMIPSLHKILAKQVIQAMIIMVVLEHIFRQRLHVQIGVIMLEPKIITEDRAFDKGWVGVELEFDGFTGCLDPPQQGDRFRSFLSNVLKRTVV